MLHGVPPTSKVLRALRERPIPSPPVRNAQRLLMKIGRLRYEDTWLRRLQAARRQAIGRAADGPPRFLVRMDEFPYYSGFDDPQFGYEASARFHSVMAEEHVPHLLSLVSQWNMVTRIREGRAVARLTTETAISSIECARTA